MDQEYLIHFSYDPTPKPEDPKEFAVRPLFEGVPMTIRVLQTAVLISDHTILRGHRRSAVKWLHRN